MVKLKIQKKLFQFFFFFYEKIKYSTKILQKKLFIDILNKPVEKRSYKDIEFILSVISKFPFFSRL